MFENLNVTISETIEPISIKSYLNKYVEALRVLFNPY